MKRREQSCGRCGDKFDPYNYEGHPDREDVTFLRPLSPAGVDQYGARNAAGDDAPGGPLCPDCFELYEEFMEGDA